MKTHGILEKSICKEEKILNETTQIVSCETCGQLGYTRNKFMELRI